MGSGKSPDTSSSRAIRLCSAGWPARAIPFSFCLPPGARGNSTRGSTYRQTATWAQTSCSCHQDVGSVARWHPLARMMPASSRMPPPHPKELERSLPTKRGPRHHYCLASPGSSPAVGRSLFQTPLRPISISISMARGPQRWPTRSWPARPWPTRPCQHVHLFDALHRNADGSLGDHQLHPLNHTPLLLLLLLLD
jgi:hypothetical protein